MNPTIFYEDAEVLVIDKPAGLIVHSDGRTEEPTLVDWILAHYPESKVVGESWTSPQGAVVTRPGIVHRLDRTTSGVMIIAKTVAAHAFLKEQFQSRSVQKEYRAFVYGHPTEDRGVIEAEIRRTRTIPPRWTAEPGGSKKRAAVTEWKVIARGRDSATGEKVSYMELFPKTGRTHQLRVHLKFIHHPVVADPLYAPGMPALLGFSRPALHAFRLTLALPSGGQKTCEAPLPEDFVIAQQRFEELPKTVLSQRVVHTCEE